jgi:hypothetical protein
MTVRTLDTASAMDAMTEFSAESRVHAATRTAPAGRRIHSLHGYFLHPVVAGARKS